jgi:hypothetical protein
VTRKYEFRPLNTSSSPCKLKVLEDVEDVDFTAVNERVSALGRDTRIAKVEL